MREALDGVEAQDRLARKRVVRADPSRVHDVETEEEIQARTAQSELGRFEDVDFEALSDASLDWRGDGVVTPFAARWLEPGATPPLPADDVWLVVGADGASNYLIAFDALEGDPRAEAATLRARVKSVR